MHIELPCNQKSGQVIIHTNIGEWSTGELELCYLCIKTLRWKQRSNRKCQYIQHKTDWQAEGCMHIKQHTFFDATS